MLLNYKILYKTFNRNKYFSCFCSGLLLMLLTTAQVNAQTPTYSPCDASPFCSDSSYSFSNIANPGNTPVTAPSGPDYGCLGSEPNPAWYYMQIGTAGTIQLTIAQTNSSGSGLDVDFAMWGPYTDLATGCNDIMNNNAPPIQCSYDANVIEVVGLGLPGGSGVGYGNPPNLPGGTTPPAAQVGEVYIVLITNFSNQNGTISFSQTDGTGSADCGIVCGLSTTTDSVACAGYPFHLGAQNRNDSLYSSITYYWSGPLGLTATGDNPTFTINQAGDYNFDVMSVSNTGDTCYQTASIKILPGGTYSRNVSICEGETYNFFGKEYYQTGVYDSLFHNVQGCDSIIQLNLTVNPLPDVSMKEKRQIDLCQGDSVRISILNPDASTSYQWTKDGGSLSGANEPSLMIYEGGTYILNAVSNKGCTISSNPINVEEHERPIAKIAALPNEIICAYDTLQLAVENPQAGYSYLWEPSDPFRAVSGNESPEVNGVFLKPTEVTVTVFNKWGCSNPDSVLVMTKPCCEVFVPNAFSPNGDGINDYFKPQLQNGQILTGMHIYNRLGQLVYNSKDARQGWNGKFENGKVAPSDTYMYLVEYTCADGKLYHKKGSVNLVR